LKKCVIEQKLKGLKIEGTSPQSPSKESPNTFTMPKLKLNIS
jgi:hypothetical protein